MNASDSNASLLAMVHDMASRLKQKHMDVEAIGCLEQALWLKWRLLGPQHADVRRSLHEVVAMYNQHAMELLSANDVANCLDLLTKADQLASSDKFTFTESLRILTYNNLGCCYRRLGKLPKALKYLHAAAAIGAETTHVKNLSITFLNLCAIESQMGRHDAALEHAQSAIFHAQEELVVDKVDADDGQGQDILDATTQEEKIVGLAIAYHNMAVELEHNRKADASLQWYKKALQLIFKYKSSNPELWQTFKATFEAAKQKAHRHRSGSPPKATTTRSSNQPSFTFENSRIATGAPTPPAATRKAHSSRHQQPAAPPAKTSFGTAQQVYQPSKPSTKPARPTSARPRAALSKTAPLLDPPLHHPKASSPPKRTADSRTPSKRHHPTAERHTVDAPKIAPTFSQLRPKSARPSQRLRHAVQASRSPVDADEDDVVEVFDDGDDDEDVLQVFDTPPQRVDVRRPAKPLPPVKTPAAVSFMEPGHVGAAKESSPVPPERVSHLAYLMQLKHSADKNVPPTKCVDITRRHKLALDVDRVQRVATLRLQALCRGHLVRMQTAAAQAHRDLQRAKELEAARRIQAKLRGGGDRATCLMTTRMELEVARIHATAATRLQAVWRGSKKRRLVQTQRGLGGGLVTLPTPLVSTRDDGAQQNALSMQESDAKSGDITTDKAKVALERRRLLDATMERERLRQEANRLELERKQVEEATIAETKRLELEATKLEAEKRRLKELAERLRHDEARQADARRQLEEAESLAARQRQIDLERTKQEERDREAARLQAEEIRRAEELSRAEAERQAVLEQEKRRVDEAARQENERRRAVEEARAQAEQLRLQEEEATAAAAAKAVEQAKAEAERERALEAAQRAEAERIRLEEVVRVEAAGRLAEAERRRQAEAAKAERIRLEEAAESERRHLEEQAKVDAERLRQEEDAKAEADELRRKEEAAEWVKLEELAKAEDLARQKVEDARAEAERIRADDEARAEGERVRAIEAAKAEDAERLRLEKQAAEAKVRAEKEAALIAAQTREVRELAAGAIQGVYKGAAVRASAMAQFARKLSRQYILQLHLNAEVNHALTVESRRIESAVLIQQHARGMLCRMHFDKVAPTPQPAPPLDDSTSTKTLSVNYSQASFDSHTSMTEPQLLDTHEPVPSDKVTLTEVPTTTSPPPVDAMRQHVESVAATAIQSVVRGRQTRLLTLATRAGMHAAAGKIQRIVLLHQLRRRIPATRFRSSAPSLLTTQPADAATPVDLPQPLEDTHSKDHDAAVQHLAASVIQTAVRDGIARRDTNVERGMARRLAGAGVDWITLRWVDRDEQAMANRLSQASVAALGQSHRHFLEVEMAKRLASACVDVTVAKYDNHLDKEMASRLAAACWDVLQVTAVNHLSHSTMSRPSDQQPGNTKQQDETAANPVKLGAIAAQDAVQEEKPEEAVQSKPRDLVKPIDANRHANAEATAKISASVEEPQRIDAKTRPVDPVASMVHDVAATCIQAALKGYTTRQHYLALKEFLDATASDSATPPSEQTQSEPSPVSLRPYVDKATSHDAVVQQVAATYIQAVVKGYLVRSQVPGSTGSVESICMASTASLDPSAGITSAGTKSPVDGEITSPQGNLPMSNVDPDFPQPEDSPASSGLSNQYSNSSFVSDKPASESALYDSHSILPAATSSQASLPSNASQASFYSEMNDDVPSDVPSKSSAPPEKVLAAAPATLAKYTAFVGSIASAPPPNDLDLMELAALDLTYESFLEAFESAYDDISVAAAADALRVLASTDPKWKTKAALDHVVALMEPKVHDPDVWTDEVNGCCMWLLCELLK